MSTNIGVLTYKITGDSSSLNREIKKTDKTVGGLSKTFKKASVALGAFFAFNKIKDFGVSAVKSAGQFEQLQIAFTTFLKDADKANETLAELQDFSVVTPFTIDQVNKAGKSLLAFGFEADELTERLEKIGNISAGTGKDFNELATLIGKARVQTTIYSEDINQFTEAGIPIIEEFAKILGVSTSEVKKLASEGKISFDTLDEALNNISTGSGQFAGLIEAQSESLLGRISTLQGNFSLLAREIGDKLVPVVGFFVDGLNKLIDFSEAESEILKETNADLQARLNILKKANLTDETRAGILKQVNEQLEKLGIKQLNEKSSIDDIAKAQEKSNKILEQKIKLEKDRESLSEKREELAELESKKADEQTAKQEGLLKAEQSYFQFQKDANLATAEIAQKNIDLIQAEIDKRKEEIEEILKNTALAIEADTKETDEKNENNKREAESEEALAKKKKKIEKDIRSAKEETAKTSIAIAQASGDLALAIAEKTLGAEKANSQEIKNIQRGLFLFEKANALALLAINTALGISRVYTEVPAPAQPFKVAEIVASGIAGTTSILAQTIKGFEKGGVIKGLPGNIGIGREDGLIAVQNNESILNKQATANLGEEGVNALNSGKGLMGNLTVQLVARDETLEEKIISLGDQGLLRIPVDALVERAD